MKITLITSNLNASGEDVRTVLRQNHYPATQVTLLNGKETRVAVEYDEQSESRPRKQPLIALAAQYGLQLDKTTVSVTPRWAAALLTGKASV